MIEHRLQTELNKVAARYQRLRLWTALAIVWLVAAGAGWLLWSSGIAGRDALSWVGGLALGLAAVAIWRARSAAPRETTVATRIERVFPELGNCLLTAIQQQPDLPDGRFGYLQSSVIRQALTHAEVSDWQRVVPSGRITAAVVAQFAALALFLGTLATVAFRSPPVAASASPGKSAQRATAGEFSFTVEPGNAEIEKGTSLLVLARVTGPVPAEGTLVTRTENQDEVRIPMTRSLNDPLFGSRVAAVVEPLDYRVEMEGQTSPTYHVTVFEFPRLARADARVRYPQYTQLEERLIQDVRTLSVVEGTTVEIICHLNKPVAIAALTESGQEPLVLHPQPGEKPVYSVQIVCERSMRLAVALTDEAGRQNVQQAELKIQVVPNQPPTVKPIFPARDVEVSSIEELDVKATVWDDFGIPRSGVTYSLAGHAPTEVVLGEQIAARDRKEIAAAIHLESLDAQPDELLAYYFWAEDFGPDGQARRTLGDMYFAEVRHFEEIFRQGEAQPGGQRPQGGQSPGGGGGANAQAAQQLGELQKEIINATWKLIRREIADRLTDRFVDDVGQVAESQAEALEQARGLAEKVNDDQSREHVAKVVSAMEQAVEHLTEARETPAREPLPTALVAEQAAYQGLLKLRAREHEIVRQQQQQQGSPGAQARSAQQRQQMQQLELKEDDNRYENQRLAQSQSPEDRESRQVLNRLRELARRQHDLNEQLKDLQSALQEAETPEKKEEIRQQLKRLQEEQEQILRDTDELKARMETPENQERMADERQQLEQARDQVQRASEALDKEQVTKAAASGTRAEQSFDDLRDEFRRQTSSQFRDQVRDLLEQSRELERQQKEIDEKIAQAIDPDENHRSLREDLGREGIAQGLADQRERLSKIIDQMQQTIQDAEQTEPLLSEKLYDAAREVADKNVSKALEAARQSIAQGLLEDSRQLEQLAGRGIGQLREKIEEAAESVLGDETESLRRAREELRNLSREVNDEIARNNPDAPRPRDPAGERRSEAEGQNARNSEGDSPADNRQEPRAGRGRGEPESTAAQQRRDQQSAGRSARRGEPGESEESSAAKDSPSNRSDGQQPGERGQPGERSQQGERGQTGKRRQQEGSQRQPGDASQPGRPGESSDDSEAEQPGDSQQPGQSQRPGQSSQPGQGSPRSQNGNPNQQQGGEQPGQPGSEQPANADSPAQPGQQPGQQPGRPQEGRNQRGAATTAGDFAPGPFDEAGNPRLAPFTGENFRNWSDRLRDVEEIVSDPELRAEAARIRDRARTLRAESKRHSKEPNWDLVRMQVAEPLVELTNRVGEELLKRNARQLLVPLDRDPVPPRFSEKTRQYYERLGSGK